MYIIVFEYLELIIYSGVLLISEEKQLNSLYKFDKLFRDFNARYEPFESLSIKTVFVTK